MIRCISYTRLTLQDWEKWLFLLRHRNQHRIKQDEGIEEYVPQDKTLGKKKKTLMKHNNLPDKEFKVMFISIERRMHEHSEMLTK